MRKTFNSRLLSIAGAAAVEHDLAARALAFMAADPDRFADFLALTGLTVVTLRAAAGEPGFARGVLSYLLADEDLLIRFAEQEQDDPAGLARRVHAAVQTDEAP